jgi:hypothetical protein
MKQAGRISLAEWKDACVLESTDIKKFKSCIKQHPFSSYELFSYISKIQTEQSFIALQKLFVLKHYAIIAGEHKLDTPQTKAVQHIWLHLHKPDCRGLLPAFNIIEQYETVGTEFTSQVQWKLDRVKEYLEHVTEAYTDLHQEPHNIADNLSKLDVALKGIAIRVSIASRVNQCRLRFGFNPTRELFELKVQCVRRQSRQVQQSLDESQRVQSSL